MINQNHSELIKLPISPREISEVILTFRKFIFSYWINSNSSDSDYRLHASGFTTNAIFLYDVLIKPIEKYLNEELIIIPDETLNYLPFECLLTKKPANYLHFKSHDYLHNKYTISYAFSATLWREMSILEHDSKRKEIVAFSPNFNTSQIKKSTATRGELTPLKWNIEEAKKVTKIISGDTFIGKEASISNFKKEASNSKIIHCSTHAKSGMGYNESYLAFDQGDKLDEAKIREMNLDADMIVLLACETGLGRIESGEGVRSLSRTFASTGVKSLLSSLWSVDDRKSYELMQNFYYELSLGYKKNVALRNAKLNLISKGSHKDAHPFFWSGFLTLFQIASKEFALLANNWQIKKGATQINA